MRTETVLIIRFSTYIADLGTFMIDTRVYSKIIFVALSKLLENAEIDQRVVNLATCVLTTYA